MFGKNSKQPDEKVDTIIGKGTSISGNLSIDGSLRVDGKVDGEIHSSGNIIIGKTGCVNTLIKGYNAFVAGEVHGDIYLEGKLEINDTGKVYGDIEVATLYISEGALFRGRSEMTQGGKYKAIEGGQETLSLEPGSSYSSSAGESSEETKNSESEDESSGAGKKGKGKSKKK